MGIKEWWSDALGTFSKDSTYRDVSEFKGMQFAVDLSIWLNKYSVTNVDKLAMTCSPVYQAPDLLQHLMTIHNTLSKDVTLVYVFDGVSPRIKDWKKELRLQDREKAGAEWEQLLTSSFETEDCLIDKDDIKKATVSWMQTKHLSPLDRANVLKWLKNNGIECYGPLFEGDQQIIKLK